MYRASFHVERPGARAIENLRISRISPPARRTKADSAKADSAKADSAAAAPIDTIDRFTALSTSRVASNDVNVSIGSRLNATIDAGRGWKFTHNLGMERKRYRQRTMEDITERVSNQADKVQPGLYRLGMEVGESFSKMKTLGLGRFGQDIIFNNTKASLEFAVLKPLLKASSSDLTIKADGSKGTNDFKFDRAYTGSASGTLKYPIGDFLTVVGGAGASGRRETSYVGRNKFGPMSSNADSVRAGLRYGRNQTKTVEVLYNWLKGVDRKLMPPLGNTYEILADPSLAKREEARNRCGAAHREYRAPAAFLPVALDEFHALQGDPEIPGGYAALDGERDEFDGRERELLLRPPGHASVRRFHERRPVGLRAGLPFELPGARPRLEPERQSGARRLHLGQLERLGVSQAALLFEADRQPPRRRLSSLPRQVQPEGAVPEVQRRHQRLRRPVRNDQYQQHSLGRQQNRKQVSARPEAQPASPRPGCP